VSLPNNFNRHLSGSRRALGDAAVKDSTANTAAAMKPAQTSTVADQNRSFMPAVYHQRQEKARQRWSVGVNPSRGVDGLMVLKSSSQSDRASRES